LFLLGSLHGLLLQVVEAIAAAVAKGLNIPIVYNTSSYDGQASLALMDGLVDIYLPDFKVNTGQDPVPTTEQGKLASAYQTLYLLDISTAASAAAMSAGCCPAARCHVKSQQPRASAICPPGARSAPESIADICSGALNMTVAFYLQQLAAIQITLRC
jgi:hypothetical protein